MPRVARSVVDGGVYHILNRGNGRQRVFHRDADYLAFEALLWQLQGEYKIDLYAYCLMPNHFHLLIKAVQGEDLSPGMQWFTTTFVRRYHRHYRTSGHLWQGRYKNFSVEGDDHFLAVARYVEGNPVRAGLVETATDWVWSSHRERSQMMKGTGSKGACPQNQNSNQAVDKGSGSKGACPRNWNLATLPVSCSEDWTFFVDTPLTSKELGQIKKRIDRQKGTKDEGPSH